MRILNAAILCILPVFFCQPLEQQSVIGDDAAFSLDAPEQIHLSYTGDLQSMFVTWSTLFDGGDGSVTFFASGESATTISASKESFEHTTLLNMGYVTRTTYTYRATMQPLQPNTSYDYFVRSGTKESATFSFKTFPDSANFKPRFAIYGDMGVANHVALAKIEQDTDAGLYDIILHIGDFAYNMNGFFGGKGDIFMNMIQPVATKLPYNFCVGNHEHHNNFSEYSGRFTSPQPSVFYHSFNVGPMHIILFTSEFYFFDRFGTEQLQSQYNWLVEDLAKANTEEARNAQPWIVALAHRPMYCSSLGIDDCTKVDSVMRTGYKHKYFKLEDLFYANGVDLQFYAHEHNYERLLPIYNYSYESVSNSSMYMDPIYPVHFVTGSAGCREFRGWFSYPKPAWSVFRTNDYGFTRLNVEDKLTLKLEQYSIEQAKVVDQLTITKSSIYPNFGVANKKDTF